MNPVNQGKNKKSAWSFSLLCKVRRVCTVYCLFPIRYYFNGKNTGNFQERLNYAMSPFFLINLRKLCRFYCCRNAQAKHIYFT